ncbi:phytoene desaturase family protein [Sphingobacterium lactis]|uniref:phytoene desaturase family protein n=1 Tax=Sphingobacterium lactis TaxID=797291 RepID=UPI003DA4786C
MKETRCFDVVVMGSGLGGLVTGLLLAKAGKKVCILEKNNQYGGNLQTFVRDREIFDSGVHYIGSLGKDQNLGKYWQHLGVLDSIHFQRMDMDHFDIIRFQDDPVAYPHAQGPTNFIQQLSAIFPDERAVLEQYIAEIAYYCEQFPLYQLKAEVGYNAKIMERSSWDVISSLTSNKKLQAVLLGNGFLYGLHRDAPFYMHALIINSYMQSAWRCIKGGSQITKAFTRQLRQHGTKLYSHQHVTQLNFDGNRIASCETATHRYEADQFISNLSLSALFKLFNEEQRNKPYVKRVQGLKEGPSVFSTHLVLNPNAIPYFNHNIYHFESEEHVFSYPGNWTGFRPKSLLITCNPSEDKQSYTTNISMLTYMDPEQVAQWKDTFNTVNHPGNRDEHYQQFKEHIAHEMISIAETYVPNLKNHIKSIHTSSPLSYRDYIGNKDGSMYGIEKLASNPMASMISPKTKVQNLVLTGQDIRLHGLLGVTITGFLAAAEALQDPQFLTNAFKEMNDD